MAFPPASFGSNNDPLAAAVAAAAALARNGGTFLYESSSTSSVPSTAPSLVFPAPLSPSSSAAATKTAAIAASPSPSPKFSSNGPANNQEDHRVESTSSSNIDDVVNDVDNDNDHEEDHPPPLQHEDDEQYAERRMARSRERNREHARRTRRRKKAQLEALQSKLRSLQARNKDLTQSLEECRIASILVGFSASDGDDRDAAIQSLLREATELGEKDIFKRLVGSKRTRFVSDASDMVSSSATEGGAGPASCVSSIPLKIEINGTTTVIGGEGPSHLNWKTGVYTDENGIRTLLTNQQLEALRRERNRMHAKMTRDRKKSYIATIERTIEELESSNQRMASVLEDVIHAQKSSPSSPAAATLVSFRSKRQTDPPGSVTPCGSPSVVPGYTSVAEVPDLIPPPPESSSVSRANKKVQSKSEPELPPKKRVCHGFSLGPYEATSATEWNRH